MAVAILCTALPASAAISASPEELVVRMRTSGSPAYLWFKYDGTAYYVGKLHGVDGAYRAPVDNAQLAEITRDANLCNPPLFRQSPAGRTDGNSTVYELEVRCLDGWKAYAVADRWSTSRQAVEAADRLTHLAAALAWEPAPAPVPPRTRGPFNVKPVPEGEPH